MQILDWECQDSGLWTAKLGLRQGNLSFLFIWNRVGANYVMADVHMVMDLDGEVLLLLIFELPLML